MSSSHKKTYIGVLASRDADEPNKKLIDIFNTNFISKHYREDFSSKFHFIFTGGTYGRVFEGFTKPKSEPDPNFKKKVLNDDVSEWLKTCSTPLPTTQEGGVIFLSYLVCQHKCSIVWMFFDANTIHWQRQENLALMRLCDQWHAKKLINSTSVEMWLKHEIEIDWDRNLQPEKRELIFRKRKYEKDPTEWPLGQVLEERKKVSKKEKFEDMTIALIAHNAMKERMIDFVVDHEAELNKFKSIITTRTTGNKIAEVTDLLEDKITKCLTGPKGGDIEVATEIICKRCDVVIFFIDPLTPHPHIEDIRVVSEACMINDHAIIATNEAHARDFMFRIVRENDGL